MTVRFYPRNIQSRRDSQTGPDHIWNSSIRQTRSRRDGEAKIYDSLAGSLTIAATGAGSLGVASIVAGGSNIAFTISGADLWRRPDQITVVASTVSAGLATAFNVASLKAALVSSGIAPYSVDVTRKILNVLLPAVAAYSPGASTAFAWNFPEVAFENRAGAFSVASAIVVTSAA